MVDDEQDTAPIKLTDIVYIAPVIPPGVSPDIAYLVTQQAQQHYDRRLDTRDTLNSAAQSTKHTNRRLDKLDVDLAAKPGKMEVRTIMVFAAGVFLLMVFAAFQKNGIDSEAAVKNTQAMLKD